MDTPARSYSADDLRRIVRAVVDIVTEGDCDFDAVDETTDDQLAVLGLGHTRSP